MGDDGVCTGELVGTERAKHILSFGEDEDGELYILTTSNPSPSSPQGVVYQIVDPARSAFKVCIQTIPTVVPMGIGHLIIMSTNPLW